MVNNNEILFDFPCSPLFRNLEEYEKGNFYNIHYTYPDEITNSDIQRKPNKKERPITIKQYIVTPTKLETDNDKPRLSEGLDI